MKSKRVCPECKKEYEPTRSDQRFCHTTCRWNSWRKGKKNQSAPKESKSLEGIEESKQNDLYASLRNVQREPKVETKQESVSSFPKPEQIADKQEIEIVHLPRLTKAFEETTAEKQRINTFGKRVETNLQTCDKEILQEVQTIERLKRNSFLHPKKNKFRTWSQDAEDLFGDELTERELNDEYELTEAKERLKQAQAKKIKLLEELKKANFQMAAIESKLKAIPQYEQDQSEEKKPEKKASLSKLMEDFLLKKTNEEPVNHLIVTDKENIISQPFINKRKENERLVFEMQEEEQIESYKNDKLKSSRELRNMKFQSFPFTGKWLEFLGRPDYAFHVAVHGKPGEGKSTFSVQLADYLAKSFGKVVYISGEEGLTKTVQDKIINNGIDNPYLFFADIRNYEEIKIEIENKYHFIFIDSLDTLRIDAMRLKELKERYPQSSFVTISQSTKDGKMRGSQEIIHDTDIAVKVENGIATTTKNRFQARGTEFIVFSKYEKVKPTGRLVERSNLM